MKEKRTTPVPALHDKITYIDFDGIVRRGYVNLVHRSETAMEASQMNVNMDMVMVSGAWPANRTFLVGESEGITWIREHHADASPQARALLTAFSLARRL